MQPSIHQEATRYKGLFLVVDDDPVSRRLVNKNLLELGYDSHNAGNGLQALDQLKNNHYPIVITDLHMPGMGGLELLKQLRSCHPDIDAIVISGSLREYDHAEMITAGVDAFLEKPFFASDLKPLIIRILQKQEEREILLSANSQPYL